MSRKHIYSNNVFLEDNNDFQKELLHTNEDLKLQKTSGKTSQSDMNWKKIILVVMVTSLSISLVQGLLTAFILQSVLIGRISEMNQYTQRAVYMHENNITELGVAIENIQMKIQKAEAIVQSSRETLKSLTNITECEQPPFVSYAYPIYSSLRVGSVVTYRCASEFLSSGFTSITCLTNGQWSRVSFHCVYGYHDSRLVNGSSDREGRVEIYHDGSWGTVCDDFWDNVDASVVCRQLGYTSGTAKGDAYFGKGSGQILMDNVRCDGSEANLRKCIFNGWNNHNCYHYEDAGVICV